VKSDLYGNEPLGVQGANPKNFLRP